MAVLAVSKHCGIWFMAMSRGVRVHSQIQSIRAHRLRIHKLQSVRGFLSIATNDTK
jgi:hypothetical protein